MMHFRTALATSCAAIAIVAGDYAGALAVAPSDGRGWVQYNRAVALAGLRRTDEAVAAFRAAERTFGAGPERAIAIYGRARALDDAHRCGEAQEAYGDYAAIVQPTRPRDAVMALAYARGCSARPGG